MATEWNTATRVVVAGICLIFMGWLIYTIQPLLAPLIVAALLAYTMSPLVKLVQTRVELTRRWAVPAVYFSCLALLIIIPGLLAPFIIRQSRRLSDELITIETQMEAALARPIDILGQELHLGLLWADILRIMTESLSPAFEGALALLEITSTSLLWLLIVLVTVYYLLLDWEGLRDWFVGWAPEPVQADILRLLHEIDIIWRAYLQGTFVLMIIVGVIFSVVWLAIGLPGALVLGILTGLLTIIPDIGPAIGAILAVLVAFFQGSDYLPLPNIWFAGLVFAIYFVLIQVKAIWLRPRVMKYFLHLNEGLIFVAIIAATVLWGILGALIIVPMLATVGVIGRYIRCRLLNLDPWPEMSVPVVSLSSEEKQAEDNKRQLGYEDPLVVDVSRVSQP